MKLRILLILITCSFFQEVFAQKRIKGKVFDASSNTPLYGASITFQGKGVTTSDREGMFSIDCSKLAQITVSFVGYQTFTQQIKNCNGELSIGLIPLDNNLNEVEITATFNQNRSILYQPASITKLDATEIKRGTGLFLDDAINANVPGVTMQRRGVSSGQQFNIRGYGNGVRGTNGLNSNFDGQGYKVYLNGIPVTDAEGITLMDDIDFGSIGNVEVTKGPAGTLYGLAIAGVVNLKTIKPEKGKTAIGQDVLVGNYGLRRYTTHLQTSSERSSLLVNYGHQKSDGFMNHNASCKDFINIAGDFQPGEKQSINAYFGYSNSYDERGGELTIDQYNKQDYSGNPEYIKRNAHSEIIGFRAGLNHTYNFNDHITNTTTIFGSAISNSASSAGGWTDKDPVNYGLRSTFSTNYILKDGFRLSSITGVETQHQRAQTIGYNMVANPADANAYWIIGAMRSNQFTVSGTTSLFTEWTLTMPHDLSVTAGVGLSTMKINLNDRFYVATNRNSTTFDTSYKGMVSPHITVNKVFSKQFSVYASYSKGYKAPVSSYFFIPTTGKLNEGLKPEVGNQFEIGTKGALINNKLTYQLALFDARFSDKMYAVAVPLDGSSTTTAYTYIANGGNQNDKGVEALVQYTILQSAAGFFKSIRPFGNLTYADFKYEDYKFETLNATRTAAVITNYDGKAVAGVSRYVANLGVDVAAQYGIYANAVYSYKDGMPITSDGLNYTTSYNLLNAKLGIARSLSKHFDVDAFIGVNNIMNTRYAYMVFVNQLPDAYLPAPGKANCFGGIDLKYNL
jgi:iron complex outermembrane receptor protein